MQNDYVKLTQQQHYFENTWFILAIVLRHIDKSSESQWHMTRKCKQTIDILYIYTVESQFGSEHRLGSRAV
jgi:hypothetical protein